MGGNLGAGICLRLFLHYVTLLYHFHCVLLELVPKWMPIRIHLWGGLLTGGAGYQVALNGTWSARSVLDPSILPYGNAQ